MFALSSLRCAAPAWLSSAIGMQTTSTIISPLTPSFQQTRLRSNRSRRGLYDGRDVRFGNNVPFSMKKTRRRWNPNVQYKRLYSEVLDEMIRFHVTTGAMRSIDKYGGLDNYLLGSPHVSTKGWVCCVLYLMWSSHSFCGSVYLCTSDVFAILAIWHAITHWNLYSIQ